MADGDAPLPSRATLSGLPLEIKALICELASLQDERYKERWIPGALGEKLIKVHLNEWRGKSLAALSETCKEFNELAAKHIFHTLTDFQIDSLNFSLVVLPRYTSRVRRVVVERPGTSSACQVACQRVFAALLSLPNLIDLQVSYDPASNALGEFGTTLGNPSGAPGQIRDAFRAVARRLQTVALFDFATADAIVSFLGMCEDVRNISITGPAIVEDEQLLSEYLGAHPSLEHLTLAATSSVSAGLYLGPEWSLPSNWTKGISGLDLINIELDASTVSLVNHHAATLRHLTFRLPKNSPPAPPPDFPSFLPMPLLSSFTLENTSSQAFEAIVTAVAKATSDPPSRSPSRLTNLTVELADYGRSIEYDHFNRTLLPFAASIRHLCVTGPRGQMLSQARVMALKSFERRDVLSSRSSRMDPIVLRRGIKKPENLAFNLEVRRDAVKAAFAYGSRLADQFVDEQSAEGMDILLEAVGVIWGHKLLRDD